MDTFVRPLDNSWRTAAGRAPYLHGCFFLGLFCAGSAAPWLHPALLPACVVHRALEGRPPTPGSLSSCLRAWRVCMCSIQTLSLTVTLPWAWPRPAPLGLLHRHFVNLAVPAPLLSCVAWPCAPNPAPLHASRPFSTTTANTHAAPLSLLSCLTAAGRKRWTGAIMSSRAEENIWKDRGKGSGLAPRSLPLLCLRLCHHGRVLVVQGHQVGLQSRQCREVAVKASTPSTHARRGWCTGAWSACHLRTFHRRTTGRRMGSRVQAR